MFGVFNFNKSKYYDEVDDGGMYLYYSTINDEKKEVYIKIKIASATNAPKLTFEIADSVARGKLKHQIGGNRVKNITSKQYRNNKPLDAKETTQKFKPTPRFLMNSLYVTKTRGFRVDAIEQIKRVYLICSMEGVRFRCYLDVIGDQNFLEKINADDMTIIMKKSIGWSIYDVSLLTYDSYIDSGNGLNGIERDIGHAVSDYDLTIYAERVGGGESFTAKSFFSAEDPLSGKYKVAVDISYSEDPGTEIKDKISKGFLMNFAPTGPGVQHREVDVNEFIRKDCSSGFDIDLSSNDECGPVIGRYMDKPINAWIKRNGKQYKYDGIFSDSYKMKKNEVVVNRLIYSSE